MTSRIIGDIGVKKMMMAEGIDSIEALRTRQNGHAAPLRACVRDAVEQYFEQLDGHACKGLYRLVLKEVEAPLLETVMRHTQGNQSHAAEVLGINRGTLRKKLRDYEIA